VVTDINSVRIVSVDLWRERLGHAVEADPITLALDLVPARRLHEASLRGILARLAAKPVAVIKVGVREQFGDCLERFLVQQSALWPVTRVVRRLHRAGGSSRGMRR